MAVGVIGCFRFPLENLAAAREAMAKKVIERRFTFHDLRAYYTTEHQERLGKLPELHANPATTAGGVRTQQNREPPGALNSRRGNFFPYRGNLHWTESH